MRTISTAATSFCMLCGVAVGADMLQPRPAPSYAPPVAELQGWTGLYIGINGGGGFGTADSDFSVGGGARFASVDLSLKGGIGGGQIGYNWQSGAMVYGLEADFQATGLK